MFDYRIFGFHLVFRPEQLHPMTVHFPIALFLVSVLFYLWARIRKSQQAEIIGLANLIAAAIGSWIAAAAGWLAEESVEKAARSVHNILEAHETLGVAVACAFTILAVWGIVAHKRGGAIIPFFLLLMFLAAIVLIAQAYLGGYMVYEAGLAVARP